MGDQAMPIEHGMNGAAGRHFDRMRKASQQPFANLARAPVRLFLFGRPNGCLDGFRQLVGVTEWAASAIAQTLQTRLLITLHNLVSSLPRDPELAAQSSHALAVL